MTEPADRFLNNAEEFRQRAGRALTAADKDKFLAIAENWMKLADWIRPGSGEASAKDASKPDGVFATVPPSSAED